MEKEFLPYEVALYLKELGFNESCLGFYDEFSNNKVCYGYSDGINKAPTFSQTFRWFREKYGLYYSIQIKDGMWFFEKWSLSVFKTYEEAELECLKKLIEIVKRK